MANVVIISDNLSFGSLGAPRYMGPYAIASQLEDSGISCIVVDNFTRLSRSIDYILQFVTTETLILGLSTTFLFPPNQNENEFLTKAEKNRSFRINHYYSGDMWMLDSNQAETWLNELKKGMLKKSPRCKLILGGVKAQFAHWRPKIYDAIDFVVLGPADFVLLELFKKIKSGEKIKILENRNHRIVDQIEFPKRTSVCPDSKLKKKFAIQKNEALPIEISRGCAFNCKFCHYEKKTNNRKELTVLKEEFIRNYDQFGTTIYHFCDDCFNDSRIKVENVCNLILSLPFRIDWVCYARFDVALKFPETVDMMISSGVRGMYMGIESFNHKVALKAGKGSETEKIKDFLLTFKKRFRDRCFIEGSFVVGLPGETKQDLLDTIHWLEKYPDALDIATFGHLGLMPYIANMDGSVFDYADYSRKPEKYGFKKVTFNPNYWEHETMNSIEAESEANWLTEEWNKFKRPGIFNSIWLYPQLRSLGLTHEEIFYLKVETANDEAIRKDLGLIYKNRLRKYFTALQSINITV